jgi:predicted hexulose-6-phosphate isomerase
MSIDESPERLARLDWTAGERRELHNAVVETGVPILTMCLSGHRKYPLGSACSETRQRALEMLRRAIDLAFEVSIRVIQIAGYYVYYEPHRDDSFQRYLDGLICGTEWAGSAGVMLALENVDGEDVCSIRTAMRLVEAVNSPWCQIYPDIGNLAEHGLDVCGELEEGRGHIVGVHVKDTRPGEPRRVPFGQGVVPFTSAFQKLATMQFGGPVMLEMWNDNSADSMRIVRDARTWVVTRMIEAGMITSTVP